MAKRSLFSLLVLLLLCSSAYAVPATEQGQGIYVWPRFFQFESPWACGVYAGHGKATPCKVRRSDGGEVFASNTIGAKGCLVTSLSMLLRFHGLTYIPNVDNNPTYNTECDDPLWAGLCQIWGIYIKTNPGELDDWFTDKGLYDSNRDPYVQSVVKNFYLNSQGQYGYYRVVPNHDCPDSNRRNCFRTPWSNPKAEERLDYDLDHGNPDIMKISWTDERGNTHDSHFVLIGGYDKENSSYRAYDPGQSYNTEADFPPGLNQLYSKEGTPKDYNPLRVDRFKSDWGMIGKPNLSELSARVYSPVEIQIIDPQGRATGYDSVTGAKAEDIPYASYSEESISSINPDDPEPEPTKELYIDRPIAGNYILKMTGTGSGPYTIVFRGIKEDGTTNLETSITGTATPTLSETYRVTYSPTGDATLSQTNQPPVANAGVNQTGEQSYEIQLDGSQSQDTDGDPLKYSWSFVSRPDGSNASLSNLNVVNPTFTPDKAGTYVLQLIVNDHFTDSAPSTVTITATPVQSRISTTPNLSMPLNAGSGSISFNLNNTGRIGVSNGVIDMNLKAPDGTLVYAGSHAFSVAVGQTATVSIPLNIPSLKFGNYALTFTQSDETKTGSPTTISIVNSAPAAFSFDKSTYRVRDAANLTLTLMNTGKFNLDAVSVTVSSPDAGYTDTRTVSIGQGQAQPLHYAMQIPETITAGQHDVNVTLSLPSGSFLSQSAKFGVQDSSLVVGHSGTGSISAGDTLNIILENAGSVDTAYSTEKLAIMNNKGDFIYQGSASGTILAGEKKSIADIRIPAQTVSGIVRLEVVLRDAKTGKGAYLYKTLTINGLTTDLFARTDKDVYLNTEAVTAITALSSSGMNIENGTLNVKVNRYKKPTGEEFSQFLPKTSGGSCSSGDGQFCYPDGVAIAPDGSVYIVELSNHRVQKFDSYGNFITKWGSPGSGNGQFEFPSGIAVSSDGAVYVADTQNHRIQKFDASGNFITKWGSHGWSGDGQFNYPMGIAVAPDGSVYVADTWNYRIQKFDHNGSFVTKWGSYGSGDGQLFGPKGIAIAPDGTVYVVDNDSRVKKFDSAGNFISRWGSLGSSYGQFYWPSGIAIALDGSVYVADTQNHRVQKFDSNGNPVKVWGQFYYPHDITIAPDSSVYVVEYNNRIQRMEAYSSGGLETLFETNLSIAQPASTTLDYTTGIGVLNATGKLYLEATLKNSHSHTVAAAEYPFYIVNGDAVLSFNTDKKTYMMGETVKVAGTVTNRGTSDATNLLLVITSQKAEPGAYKQTFYSKIITVPAGGSYPFTFATAAEWSEGTTVLTGTVSQNGSLLAEVAEQYEVATPAASLNVIAPDVTGSSLFDLNVEIKNTGKGSVSGQIGVFSNQGIAIGSQQIILSEGETKLMQYPQQITANTTYTVNLSGDVPLSAAKTVLFGEAATVTFGDGGRGRGVSAYPEGKVAIPVAITNTEQLNEQIQIMYQLNQDTARGRGDRPTQVSDTRSYYLPKGEIATDTLYYDLATGSYQLSAVSYQPNATAQTSLSVVKENNVSMTTSSGSQGVNGSIPVMVDLANNGSNVINGSIQATVVNNEGKNIWRGEVQASGLSSQAIMRYTINVDSAGIAPGEYKTDIVLYSTSGLQLAANQVQVRVSGPIFEITAIPPYSTFTVGKPAVFTFAVKNTGTAAGEMSFRVKAVEVLDSNVKEVLQPGQEKPYAFNFTVPEDAEEKDYLAAYTLTSPVSQGTKGQATLHVAGVNVGATASLDKQAYINGDTAVLSLSVSKLSQFEDGDYLAIIRYGSYHDMKPFTLTNQGTTLMFSVPLPVITGENLFYSIHFQSGRTIYRNSIFINRVQPDLTIDNLSAIYGSIRTYKLEATVVNHGDLSSDATNISFYDGDPSTGASPIATVSVPALSNGQSITLTTDWDVLGKGGSHSIYAVVDPNNAIIERIEVNNTQSVYVTVPSLSMDVSTTHPRYEANQDVGIAETVINLTGGVFNDLNLTTVVKDDAGSAVSTFTNTIPTLNPGEALYAGSWNTASNRSGNYTVSAFVSDGSPLTTASTTFEILPTVSAFGDMTLSYHEVVQGFPVDISYTLTNNGNLDITGGEVGVEVENKTTHTTATFAASTLEYLSVLSSTSGGFIIERVDIEPGEYTLNLTLTANGRTINISSKDLIVKPPLKVTKGISMMPRVLVWTQPVVSGQGLAVSVETATDEKIAVDALARLGAYYKIVHSETEFMESMRSGYYNTYALLDTDKPTTDGLTSELAERVYGGDTLILMGSSNMDEIKVTEVTGTKFTGYLPDGTRTTTIGMPFYEQSANITIAGKAQKVTMTSATAYATGDIADIYPSIIVNSYGRGKGVLVTFDLGRSAEVASDITTYSALFARIIGNTAPIETRLIPEGVAPVEITVESIGSAFDLRAMETVDRRVAILDASLSGLIDTISNTVTWYSNIGSTETVRYLYLSGLSQFRGTYSTEAEVYYQNKGEYKLYNRYPLNIELVEGTAEIQNNILYALNLLSITKDKQRIKDGVEKSYLTLISKSSGTRREIDGDIHDLLKITEDLKKLEVDISVIRSGLDDLLGIFQRRWAIAK